MFDPSLKVSERYKSTLSHPLACHGGQYKIIKHVGQNKTVLDVGCASGYLCREFKNNGCYVVGIELDEEAARVAASSCDNVIVADVEKVDKLPYPAGFFNRIVFGDIPEHLQRLDLVLARFSKYLSRDGLLIAVIPNIAYAPVRFRLLLGRFDYQECGHLDRTHLRSFTLRTARELITSQGYNIKEIDYTGPTSMIRILPTLFAAKFVIVAEPT